MYKHSNADLKIFCFVQLLLVLYNTIQYNIYLRSAIIHDTKMSEPEALCEFFSRRIHFLISYVCLCWLI